MKQKLKASLITCLVLIAMLLSKITKAQGPGSDFLSPKGALDTIYDMFGNKKLLRDIMFEYNPTPGSGFYYLPATTTASTNCGYFNVYYANGSGMENSSNSTHLQRRAVICQVLSDLSAFINSPLSISGVNINLLIDDQTVASSLGAAGVASGYYAHASSPQSANPGIADNEIWKTIHAGTDSYTNVAPPVDLSINGFYHGFMAFDFTLNWNTVLTSTATATQIDLYTVALHEITHALGFASLINSTGLSKFGTASKYYSRYDLFLKNKTNLPLLMNTGGACSSMYGKTFNSSVNVSELQPATATCTNDIYFAGSVNQKCYTPSIFTNGSSLSHFEDICHSPSPYTNGTYYVMNASTPNGITKRYLKQEERMAMCDLGYSTNTTYGTAAYYTAATYTGTCNSVQVAGINDGIVSGSYIYSVTSVSPITTLSISLAAIAGNDYATSGTVTPTCIESVYANGTVAIVTNSVVFTSNSGYTGPVVLRYLPTNAGGVIGNITYVFGFILPAGCTPVSPCDMVQNGGFENITDTVLCGQLGGGLSENCWYTNTGTPDVFTRGCTNQNLYNLGTNTFSLTSPAWNSFTTTANNTVLGLYQGYVGGGVYNESIQNFLGASLTNGTVYQLSYWYYNFSGTFRPPNNPYTFVTNSTPVSPCIISFAAKPSVSVGSGYPGALPVMLSNTLTTINAWTYVTNTFTYTGTTGNNVLTLGLDLVANGVAGYTVNTIDTNQRSKNFYVLIDDVSLLPVGISPTLTIPSSFCTSSSLTDLAQYANPGGGVFSGTGVTNTGGIYDFNNPSTLSPGTYTVTYTYTTGIGCSYTAYSFITLTSPTVMATASPTAICAGKSSTLTATGAIVYRWHPGALTGASVVVSPTATTVYTVTGRIGDCTNTKTVSVSINPPPVPAITGSSVTCSGSSVTLTGSGVSTYTWAPCSTGCNTSTISALATTVTVYTLSGTNVNGCTGSNTFTVTGIPVPTLTANSATICAGSSATLTAAGATNYTWSPGSSTLNPIVVTPTATTIYTVTGKNAGCNTAAVKTVTVTTAPNVTYTVSVTASTINPCLGSSLTLTASVSPAGTYTYNWTTPLSQTTSVVTFSPTDNYVYSCNVSDVCGNNKTGSMCVSVVSNRCCGNVEATLDNLTLNGSNSFSHLSGGIFKIKNTITITGNVSWSNVEFRMMQSAKIIVQAGAKLTITGSQLYSCTNMWEGIVLQSGLGSGPQPTVSVTGSSIEDAYKAISYDAQADVYNANIITSGSTFNKNYISVNLENTTSGVASSVAQNDDFTSQPSTNSPGNNLKCSGFYSPSIKSRAFAGVNFINQPSDLHVGDEGLNPANTNTFNNLDYGVKIDNSIVRVFTSDFTMSGDGIVTFPATPPVGVGVYSTNSANTSIAQFLVEKCNFTNVNIGVYADNTNALVVQNNVFNTTAGIPVYSNILATAALKITNTISNVHFTGNLVTNFVTGINSNNTVPPSPTFSSSIVTNTITANAGGYCNQAILLQSAVGSFTSTTGAIAVYNNSIAPVYNGIYASYIKNGLRISNNTVGVAYASGIRSGIRLTGTENATVDNNTISSTATTNTNLRGIYLQLSPNCFTQCNTINTVGQSILIEGNCLSPNTGLINNIMNNANDGLVLKTNGIIGLQGYNSTPAFLRRSSGNQWTGTFANSKTLVMDAGSSAQNSNLIVKNSSNEYPQPQTLNKVAGSAANTIDNWGTSLFNLPASIFTVTTANYSCPTAQTQGFRMAQTDPADLAYQQAMKDSALYSLLEGPNEDAVIISETREINRSYVYSVLDHGYGTNHRGLKAFYSQQADSALANYSKVDSLIQNQNYADAQTQNMQATGNSQIEYNQQLVNKALITYGSNGQRAITQSDMDELMVLANACPLQQGPAVYQARSIVSAVSNYVVQFAENCEFNSKTSGRRTKANPTQAKTNSFNLYPNPNNGHMYLNYHVDTDATIHIYDISGRVLYTNNLSSNNTILPIHLVLSEGIYFYSVTDDADKLLKTDKLIIMK